MIVSGRLVVWCLLVRSSIVFWPLELNFKSLHSNLETVHGRDGGLCTSRIIKTDKSKALALVGRSVNEDFGADNVPEGKKHLHELSITKLLGKVVDEEIATLRSAEATTCRVKLVRNSNYLDDLQKFEEV